MRPGRWAGNTGIQGVDAERPKESANVVPDCLGAQVEFGSDLLGRAALFQQTKHLVLTRGEVRGWRSWLCRGGILRSARSTGDRFTTLELHRADLH